MMGRWIFIRDKRLTRTAKIVLAVIAIAALLAMLPLRLVLGWADPSGRTLRAQAVEGVAWDGLVGELQLGPLPLGLMEVDLMPLPLLIGRAQFALERPDYPGARPFSARVRGSGGNLAISHASGEVPLGGMMAPLPVRTLTMNGFSAQIDGGACVAASGTLGLVVPAMGAMVDAETVLAGEARCEDGSLVVPMTGPSGAERVDFRIAPDGRWTATMSLIGVPPEMATPLIEMGFEQRRNGVGMTASGTL
ncbi:type II secretion system protein N [Croceicoccus sp. Ery5]|uniref:type II secretion system protein N n=1 Tax=Croceicoccus sp. Ery5 TaxID=1703340 RepID=UPI001E3384E8|nr:type II secretion system protein N [Croceicoccus sp. Ery5]